MLDLFCEDMPLIFKLFANPAALDWIYSYKVDWNELVV